jgi:hypothetical protein
MKKVTADRLTKTFMGYLAKEAERTRAELRCMREILAYALKIPEDMIKNMTEKSKLPDLPSIPDPQKEKVEELKAKLKKEEEKLKEDEKEGLPELPGAPGAKDEEVILEEDTVESEV